MFSLTFYPIDRSFPYSFKKRNTQRKPSLSLIDPFSSTYHSNFTEDTSRRTQMKLKNPIRLRTRLPKRAAVVVFAALAVCLIPITKAGEFRLEHYSTSGDIGTALEYEILNGGGKAIGNISETVTEGATQDIPLTAGDSLLRPSGTPEYAASYSYTKGFNSEGELHLAGFEAATTFEDAVIASVSVEFDEVDESFAVLEPGEERTLSVNFTEREAGFDGESIIRTGNKQLSWKLEGYEEVTVPAGTFSAARLRVATTLTYDDDPDNPVTSTERTWRVKNLGIVKRGFQSQSPDSPAKQELTAYSIPEEIEPPEVRITSPRDGEKFQTTDTISVQVALESGDSDRIENIEFFANDEYLGQVSSVDQSYFWLNPPAGDYVLRLRVTDPDSRVTESEPVAIAVSEPSGEGGGDKDDSENDTPDDWLPDGLIAYYPLTEGSGTTASDASGFGDALDLTFNGGAEWLSGGGVRFDGGSGALRSDGAATKLVDQIRKTGQFTLEVWAKPTVSEQYGPARIVTSSDGHSSRNFTLGQGQAEDSGSDLNLRLRTTESDSGFPQADAHETVSDGLAHYVVTYDGRVIEMYRDGNLIHSEERTGGLENWDSSYPLLLGNETSGNRGWAGELYQVAIYDRPLTAAEVHGHFSSGYERINQPVESHLVAQDIGDTVESGSSYFDEGSGVFRLDASGEGIGGRKDGFHFLYQRLEGDGVMIARVVDIDGGERSAQAGIMIRESLVPDSRHALVAHTPQNLVTYKRRMETGDFTLDTSNWGTPGPIWLKLERNGNEIKASSSRNGSSWQTFETYVIDLPETVYIGLAHSSENNNRLGSARFDSVQFPHENENGYEIIEGALPPSPHPAEEPVGTGEPRVNFSSTGGSLFPVEANSFFLLLHRDGDTENSLSVKYEVSGPGMDLLDPTKSPFGIWIPAGADRAILPFQLSEEAFIPEDTDFTVTIAGGDNYDTGSRDKVTFTIAAHTGHTWQAEHFTESELDDPSISGDHASPAGDGVPNLLKYALGQTPGEPMPADRRPTLVMSEGQPALAFKRPKGITDVRYIVEVSNDMKNWVSGTRHVELEISQIGDTEHVTARDRLPAGTEAQRFMRLRVERR